MYDISMKNYDIMYENIKDMISYMISKIYLCKNTIMPDITNDIISYIISYMISYMIFEMM